MTRLSLPQHTRITKQAHFQHVFRKGRRAENSVIRIYIAQAKFDRSHQAFVASKKVGKAVQRNFCKRRLKELYRQHQHQLRQDLDWIFVSKKELHALSYTDAEAAFLNLARYAESRIR